MRPSCTDRFVCDGVKLAGKREHGQGLALVVNVQLTALASATSSAALTALVSVAAYWVEVESWLDGTRVALFVAES